jgi:hypothetical protein
MRLSELTEIDQPEGKILDAFRNIKQQCAPFLQEIGNDVKNNVLYRGLKVNAVEEEVGIKNVRLADRVPKDMAMNDHVSLNAYFEKNYGHPYRNSLFVSGTRSIAAGYGKPYAIFPMGKFEYIWHPEIMDLYDFVGDEPVQLWEKVAKRAKSKGYQFTTWDAFIADHGHAGGLLQFHHDTEIGRYLTQDLIGGIQHHGMEIMIWCQQYYYLDQDYLPMLNTWLKK